MAEKQDQGHDEVCSEATGKTCICECRGRMHGMRAAGGKASKLRRMGDVAVTAKSSSAPAGTAAERRRNPVTLVAPSGAKVTSNRSDSHGVVEGSRAAQLRDEQTKRVRAATREALGNKVPDLSPGKPEGATISKADAAEIMLGPVVMWMEKGTNRPVRGIPSQVAIVRGDVIRDKKREDKEKARRARLTGGEPTPDAGVLPDATKQAGPPSVVKKPATPNRAAEDAATVRPPENADPTPRPSSNEPLWMDKRTGVPVRYPSQVAIVRGDVVRDKQREAQRAAQNAKPGDAVEVDLFGNATIMGGATNYNDQPKPKTSGSTAQQLGMFADESRELPGQQGLTDVMNPDAVADAYDRPAEVQKQVARPTPDAPAVPADLAGVDDARLEEMVTTTGDEADLARLLAEIERREESAAYQRVLDSVPDAEGLKAPAEQELIDLYVAVTSTATPDAPTMARIEAELDRRDEIARREQAEEAELARNLQIARTAIDEIANNPNATDAELNEAAEMAQMIDDEALLILVGEVFLRREAAEQARLDAAAAAAAKVEADRLAAEQEQARQRAAQVAAEEAAREALDAEFRAMYPSELSREYVNNAASMDPEKQRRYAAAEREMSRRQVQKAEEDRRKKIAERHERMSRGPVRTLSDDELREAIAGIEADGLNSNTVRQRRLVELKEEKAVRDQEAARVAAIKAAVPTAPARLRNPIGALRDLKLYAEHDQGIRSRLVRARMAALGVAEPEVKAANEWQAWKEKEKARKKAIDEAAKADPRSAGEQAAAIIAQYRHLAKIDNPELKYEHERRYQFGPEDEPNAPPYRTPAPFEKIPKAYEVFQDIRRQAQQDRAAGNLATATRAELAYRRALGLPDDATDDEVRQAYGGDERSSGDLASAMVVEFRAQAIVDGVDPDDRLRFGPKLKTPRAKSSTGYRGTPTKAQQDELDRRIAAGEDYIEVYAAVFDLDPQAMREQEAAYAAGGGQVTGGRTKTLKAAYEEFTRLQFMEADEATNGYLLSKRGKAENRDPESLFSGPLSQARPYASEELLRFWADNPRMTFAEFKANATGGARAARAKASASSNGKDFV
jgi:hypothetical protein